jgi:methionine aminopeptidase
VLSVLKNKSGNRYNNVYNALAFPVGVNKNDVAAHYSPRDWEDAYLDLKRDSVSVDFGLFEPSLGLITDGAFTWNGSEDYVGT